MAQDDWVDDSADWADDPPKTARELIVKPQPGADTYKGETSFGAGFRDSLVNGDALGAGLQGGLGFLRGATLDLPGSMLDMAKSAGRAFVHPMDEGRNLIEGLRSLPGNVIDTAMRSGSDPQAFGRMMGQMTGQPLVTAGLAKPGMIPTAVGSKIPGVGMAARGMVNTVQGAGKAVSGAGRLMETNALSDLNPVRWPMRTPPTIARAERAIGRGVNAGGKWLQGYGKTAESAPAEAVKNTAKQAKANNSTGSNKTPKDAVKDKPLPKVTSERIPVESPRQIQSRPQLQIGPANNSPLRLVDNEFTPKGREVIQPESTYTGPERRIPTPEAAFDSVLGKWRAGEPLGPTGNNIDEIIKHHPVDDSVYEMMRQMVERNNAETRKIGKTRVPYRD